MKALCCVLYVHNISQDDWLIRIYAHCANGMCRFTHQHDAHDHTTPFTTRETNVIFADN